MPHKKRPLNREGGVVRDASLIVIASEDTYAVDQYFSQFKTRRVHIEVLPTEDCRSAPQHVLDRLTEFENQVPIEKGDTLWLCIDRDRWDANSLATVIRESMKRGHMIALSNPCFDLWVLLHFRDVAATPRNTCAEIKSDLKTATGGYAQKCCKTLELTKQMVQEAMERARAMDGNATELLPDVNMTRVYQILDALVARDAIEFILRPIEPKERQIMMDY